MGTGYKIGIILLIPTICYTSCKKFVAVDAPVTSINTANVYTTDATAAAVLTGIYTNISNADATWTGITSLYLYASLSADELTLFDVANSAYSPYYINKLSNSNTGIDFWISIYPLIYDANAAIEGLSSSNGLTIAVKRQALGEAYFLRAFFYFYLTNLYGDVPLVTSTDYKKNAALPRTPKEKVWLQIVTDLHLAQGLLSSDFLDGTLLKTTAARLRPTSWAAAALLARAYLFTGNWTGADSAASAVIANSNFSLAPLAGSNQVFSESSVESIWQLQSVGSGPTFNTGAGLLFVLPSTGPNISGTYPVFLSSAVVNSFEPGDQRRAAWVDSVNVDTNTYFFPFKYQAGRLNTVYTENTTVLRLAEQYLIRAEARAHEGVITGPNSAATDLDSVRLRAGLAGTSAITQADMLTAILHERKVELFTEWGHRWFDLKRTGMVDAVMGAPGNACVAKGGSWTSNWQWYPISKSELTADIFLQQNEGY